MKKFLLPFLIIVAFLAFVDCARGGDKTERREAKSKPPKIEDFNIKQQGTDIIFFISYSNVEGGIENAKLILRIGFTFKGKRFQLEPYMADYKKEKKYEVITPPGDISKGSLTITSKTTVKNLKDVEDVTYDILLIDKNGRISQLKTAEINFYYFEKI